MLDGNKISIITVLHVKLWLYIYIYIKKKTIVKIIQILLSGICVSFLHPYPALIIGCIAV